MESHCDRLAEQIAHNRERAGVHFPSDTAASKKITDSVLAHLMKVKEFKTILQQAKKEWPESAKIHQVDVPKGRSAASIKQKPELAPKDRKDDFAPQVEAPV